MIEFQFLGTSAGIPTKHRNVSGLVVKFMNEGMSILIDCGESSQHQIMYSTTSVSKIRYIFITHMHADHILGIPGLLATRALQNCTHSLQVIGPVGIKDYINNTLKAIQCKLTYPLNISEIDSKAPTLNLLPNFLPNFDIQTIPLSHNVPSYAYAFAENAPRNTFAIEKARASGIPAGPLYQKLKEGKSIALEDGRVFHGKDFVLAPKCLLKFIVAGDNSKPSLLAPYLQNCHALVHEATFTEFDFNKLPRQVEHSTLESVCQTAQSSQVPNLVVTHFSPRYHLDLESEKIDAYKQLCAKHYEGKFFFARDLARYSLNAEGILAEIL